MKQDATKNLIQIVNVLYNDTEQLIPCSGIIADEWEMPATHRALSGVCTRPWALMPAEVSHSLCASLSWKKEVNLESVFGVTKGREETVLWKLQLKYYQYLKDLGVITMITIISNILHNSIYEVMCEKGSEREPTLLMFPKFLTAERFLPMGPSPLRISHLSHFLSKPGLPPLPGLPSKSNSTFFLPN